MIALKTTLHYKVPGGLYCNLHYGLKMPKPKPENLCRFCIEVSKSNFVCVLHNIPLLLESGLIIHKTKNCLAKVKEIKDE